VFLISYVVRQIFLFSSDIIDFVFLSTFQLTVSILKIFLVDLHGHALACVLMVVHVPTPLIQLISRLICYKEGELFDAHELLIAMINDISVPISQIFQGQMTSTVQCAHCDNVTTTTAHTQIISLHIDADSNTFLGENLLHFFQPETLEGDNSYWCNTCLKLCRATKALSHTHVPTILIIHLKRLILGRKIQTHVPFDTVLDMKPYLAPGHVSTQTMELIGIMTH